MSALSINFAELLAVITMAAISNAHCGAMCGCISSLMRETGGQRALAKYYFGRTVSYSLVGALFAQFGAIFPMQRYIEDYGVWVALGAALIFYSFLSYGVITLASRHLHRAHNRLLKFAHASPYVIGFGQVLLPCGMLVGWLAVAAASAVWWRGAFVMSAFSIMTIPGLALGARLFPRIRVKWRSALLLGMLTISVGHRLSSAVDWANVQDASSLVQLLCGPIKTH